MATIDAQEIRESIRRFRVLIIGRANAGKTTILQKTDAAVVNATIKRGNHNITNEMVFKSNPGFLFHDSCGFEAGSEEEFEDMKKFISQRVHATKLEERIHAIWQVNSLSTYCIPMDESSRTFQRSEEKFFFECDTGHVPVIAVFTKFEALRPVAYGEIKKEIKGVSAEERSKRIAQRVEELFTKTGVCDRLCDPENRTRPKFHVRLENMNKPNTNCDTLLERTTFALDNDELRLCLVSTQQSNLDLVSSVPSQQSLIAHISNPDYVGSIMKSISITLLSGFHISKRHAEIRLHDILIVLQPLVAKGSMFTSGVNIIVQTGIATIIVLEYSAFLANDSEDLEFIESAVDYYLKSPTAVVVEQGAKEISGQGYDGEELEKKIIEFILENRLSKDLKVKK
ncbi:hypothetical protein EV424DRAFT_1648081 [Suillus variegatus]|nr:hypothetical protein EV424DRAFT_1648081 [Suillus variegatus]